MTTCAFADCQAGGVILERAPRHAYCYVVHDSSRPAVASYHPGCWDAERREHTDHVNVPFTANEHAWHTEGAP